jgi:hypothetical protein
MYLFSFVHLFFLKLSHGAMGISLRTYKSELNLRTDQLINAHANKVKWCSKRTLKAARVKQFINNVGKLYYRLCEKGTKPCTAN